MAKAKTSMNMMAAALAPVASSAVTPKVTDGVKATPPARKSTASAKPAGDILNAKPAKAPKEKKPEGPVAIETKGQLLKALWSSRGNVFVTVDGIRLAIQKSSYTEQLKSSNLAEPALHDLVSKGPAESDLVLRK